MCFVLILGSEIRNLWGMPFTLDMHCSHIFTHYSERPTQVVFQLCVHFGWSSLLTKLLSAMTKLSWLGTVFWCKGSILRCSWNIIFTCFGLFCFHFFWLVSLLHFLRCNPVFLKLIHKLNSFQPASKVCISVFARGTVLVWPENWNYLQRRYDTQVRGFRRDYSCFSKGWNHHTKERPVSTKLYPDGKWSLHSGEYLMLKWPFYKYAAASDYLKYGCAYVPTLSYSIFISIFVVFALRDLNSHFSILLGL